MDKDVHGVIYKITNKINGKSYIGRTSRCFDKRYKNGQWWIETDNLHLWRSVRKHGLENFYVIKEFDYAFSRAELYRKEGFYIEMLEASNPAR